MLLGLTNTPRDYAWGSHTAIAELLGHPASGGPEAELWLGAHPQSPSTIASEPGLDGQHLDAAIRDDPEALVGPGRDALPFLLKVLAADRPLSLQVHPDAEQARAGFEREEKAGVPVDAPERNYRDASAKPELILALSPTFEALAGFRHVSEARLVLAELAATAPADDRAAIEGVGERLAAGDPATAGAAGSSSHVLDDGMPDSAGTLPAHFGEGNPLQATVEWLLRGGDDARAAIDAVARAAERIPATSAFGREAETVRSLAGEYPGDPGIVISLLLNRVSLPQGQVLQLPAGTMHAYLQGVGIELMSSSDNVLRGGLTDKHVDVDELLSIVRFESLPTPILRAEEPEPGLRVWRPDVGDFVLEQATIGDAGAVHGYQLAGPESVSLPLTGPAIVLVLTGGTTIQGQRDRISLARGDAAYATPDEAVLTLAGSALAMVATTP